MGEIWNVGISVGIICIALTSRLHQSVAWSNLVSAKPAHMPSRYRRRAVLRKLPLSGGTFSRYDIISDSDRQTDRSAMTVCTMHDFVCGRAVKTTEKQLTRSLVIQSALQCQSVCCRCGLGNVAKGLHTLCEWFPRPLCVDRQLSVPSRGVG